MKFSAGQRFSVSLAVLFAFAFLLCFEAVPVRAAAATSGSDGVLAAAEAQAPACFEKEGVSKSGIRKEKKFPWLLVGLGAAAVGVVVLVLLLKKPKYSLKVRLGVGVSGTPAETVKYKKGTVVHYDYRTLDGYMALVTLDGVEVPSKGKVTMDRDHALAVTAEPSFTLTVSITSNASGTPAATTQYKRGAVVSYSYTAASGYGLEVKLDGVTVPAAGTITMDKDKTLVVAAELLDIRGTWQLSMVYLTSGYDIYNYTSTWVFSGNRESGTFVETAGPVTNHGTYTVTNLENVWFKYDHAQDTFTGKITGKRMSGTFAAGSAYNGTWSGTKTSSATSGMPIARPAAAPPADLKPWRN